MPDYPKHPTALVETDSIGAKTRIWAFVHILDGAVIGGDCNICDHVFVEGGVVVGDRVTIKSGVQLWEGVRVEDDVFIGPNASFTNDLFPRSKQYPPRFAETRVEKGASIGAGATILAGIRIGRGAMVGAGAVVTRDVPPHAIVVGNPARIRGYVTTDQTGAAPPARPATTEVSESLVEDLGVGGARLYRQPIFRDLRGSVVVGEWKRTLPFVPTRYFAVFNVPGPEVRGQHAHRRVEMFMVAASGSCSVVVDDSDRRREVVLDTPAVGLYVPPLVWRTHYKYSCDAVLLVLASEPYDTTDYIRSYDEFRALVQKDA